MAGLTTLVYNQWTMPGLRPHLFPDNRLTTARVISDFLMVLFMCWFQVSLESKMTPRYLTSPCSCISSPRSLRGPKPSKFFLLVNGTMVVFWGLILSPSLTTHSVTALRALCILSFTVLLNLP